MEPLPCPFCGAAGKVSQQKSHHFVKCASRYCLVRPQAVGLTREAAIAAWNTRPGVPGEQGAGGEGGVNGGS